jgi:hypothetical protein
MTSSGPSRAAAILEAVTKVTVLVSVAAALTFEAVLAAHGWPGMQWYALAAGVASFALTRWQPAAGWAAVFASLYFSPAFFLAVSGRHVNADDVVCMTAGFGAILASGSAVRWSVPARWRWPIAYWALALALVWPFVVWREVDFVWALLNKYTPYRLANSGLGGTPGVITLWILYVTLTHLIGLLVFDALWRLSSAGGAARFLRRFIYPLAGAAVAACMVGVYQGNVDIEWLNGHQWPSLNRAGGTLVDGDAFGVLAAMWTMGFLALSIGTTGWRFRLAVAAQALAWAALWATGSRSALALAAGAAGLTAILAAVQWLRRGSRIPVRKLLAGAAVLIVLATVIVSSSSANNPARRLAVMMDTASTQSLKQFAIDELWNRHAPFGTVSMMMVRQHPMTGVGVGSFHHMFPDFAYSLTGWNRYFFDNAQSWYRHHVAELGLLGAAGLIVWTLSFLWMLIRTREERSIDAAALKSALIGLGLIATVSMPTQNLTVSLSFWLFAIWYLHASAASAEMIASDRVRDGVLPWLVVIAAAAAFAGLTFEEGLMKLRPAYRAVAADWHYSYGFEALDTSGPVPIRWISSTRAVDVIHVEGRQWVLDNQGRPVPPPPGTATPQWVKLTISGAPPDAVTTKFRLRVMADKKLIADYAFFDGKPKTWYIELTPGQRYMLLEVRTNRTWRPIDYGISQDPRSLSVAVHEIVFVHAPSPGGEIFPLERRQP